jgi:hypothetical protein
MTTEAARPLVNPLTCIRWPANLSNLYVSFAVCTVFLLFSLLVCDECHHWFVIPVLLCGTVIGPEALKWLRGRVDVFDSGGILGLVCMHVYFFAPLLHLMWDWWMPFVDAPDDWRPWVGAMAWMNLAGWGIYLTVKTFLERWLPPARTKTVWQIEPRRFIALMVLAMGGSAALQLMVYASFGGISGYMQTFIEVEDGFTGMGWVFMFSEAFPILAVIGATYWARRWPHGKSWLVIFAILAGFFVLKMFFGGLRGSRGHTIYGLFWAAGIVHLMLRPIPRKMIAVGGAFLLAFMYMYLFYKTYGHEAVEALGGGSSDREARLEEMNRSYGSVALGDLGRTDVQAFLLYRLSPECRTSNYPYAWGQTYVGAAALLIPSAIFPDKPPTKIKAGTDALFGPGVYDREFLASNAYGLAGEAMLNFGPIGIPLSFALLGVVIVYTRRCLWKYQPGDSRRYLAPFVISLSYMIFIWDSDIVLFYIVKEGFVPATLLFLASRRIPLAAQPSMEAIP